MSPQHPGTAVRVSGLTKRFGSVLAVDGLEFEAAPGRVCGFLGPNGSGKTTTLRCLLGLVTPTQGSATIGGSPYRALRDPLLQVGAVLEASDVHPGRSGRDHLRVQAAAAGVAERRVDEVLDLVGLSAAARRRTGGWSLGMRQRLALAAAMLGDPPVLLLDEPANGLDPEGIRWLRGFLRALAAEGRTVLVSSHVLAEVQQTVDDVVVIAGGRLVRAAPLAALEEEASGGVEVRSPDPAALADALARVGLAAVPAPSTAPSTAPSAAAGDGRTLLVLDTTCEQVGHAAYAAGVEVHGLRDVGESLEDVFLRLVGHDGEGRLR